MLDATPAVVGEVGGRILAALSCGPSGTTACGCGNPWRSIGTGPTGFALTCRGLSRCCGFRRNCKRTTAKPYGRLPPSGAICCWRSPRPSGTARCSRFKRVSTRHASGRIVCQDRRRRRPLWSTGQPRLTARPGSGVEVVKYASAHDLRRSFGFRWADRVDTFKLQELMRHSNIETTRRLLRRPQCPKHGREPLGGPGPGNGAAGRNTFDNNRPGRAKSRPSKKRRKPLKIKGLCHVPPRGVEPLFSD